MIDWLFHVCFWLGRLDYQPLFRKGAHEGAAEIEPTDLDEEYVTKQKVRWAELCLHMRFESILGFDVITWHQVLGLRFPWNFIFFLAQRICTVRKGSGCMVKISLTNLVFELIIKKKNAYNRVLNWRSFIKRVYRLLGVAPIRSDKELTLETSAPESLYDDQFTWSTQLIKPNYLEILPPTQHHSFKFNRENKRFERAKVNSTCFHWFAAAMLEYLSSDGLQHGVSILNTIIFSEFGISHSPETFIYYYSTMTISWLDLLNGKRFYFSLAW